MLDIKFVKENPELVKENIKRKFKDHKLPLVDEAIALYDAKKDANDKAGILRANRNKLSKEIGMLMGQGKKEEAEAIKAQVTAQADELKALEVQETELEAKLKDVMMKIPNIVDPSVPVGKDDSENVEVKQYGEKTEKNFEIPYHTDIMAKFDGIDKEAEAVLQVKASITLWVILQDFTALLQLTQEIL